MSEFHTEEATMDDVRKWAWSRKIPVHTVGYPPKAIIRSYNRANPDRQIRMPGVGWLPRERIAQAGRNGAASRYKHKERT